MSKTMKAARFDGKGGKLVVDSVPVPEPKKGQVRVHVKACGVCHSDVLAKYQAWGCPAGRIPGHEVAGVIDVVGEGTTKFKPGDKVGVGWFGGHCGSCPVCLEDDWVSCQKGEVCGVTYDGGYAEYVVVPEDAVARVPEEISFEEAAPLMCAGITVFNSMRNQNVKAGSLVAVQGVGGLGHLAIQFAAKLGFKVAVISSGSDKEELARKLGGSIYIDASKADAAAELTKLGGAKMIVATAPNPKVIEPLVAGLGQRGKLLIVAVLTEPLAVDTATLLMGRRSVVAWASGDSRDTEETLRFAALTGVKAQIEVFPLDKAAEAFEKMESNKVRFRAVLKM